MLIILQVTGISIFVVTVAARRKSTVDPVVPLMCSENGSQFWTALLKCSTHLTPKGLEVLKICVPHSNPKESERSRLSVCSDHTQWQKMMNCMNDEYRKRQNHMDVKLELSPGTEYRKCVTKLVEKSSKKNDQIVEETK